MFSKRLRQLRLARGLSLETLAELLGVSKQAISKYETGKAQPSSVVLVKLAEAIGVKAIELLAEPKFEVEFPGYRKQSRLGKKDRERLESIIAEEMQRRVRVQEVIGEDLLKLPVQELETSSPEDAEDAATKLRRRWDLGTDPVGSLIETLENHLVHVVEVDAPLGFDGISAIVRDAQGRARAAGAVTRQRVSGERQRFNVAHELGHLVLNMAPNCDVESAAHRFAAAFLMPAQSIRKEIGNRRSTVQLEELKYMRRRYGVSLQASLRRLRDLEIISDAVYKEWCINFSRWGWRKQEPDEAPQEQPQWLRRNVLRAVGEGLMTAAEAESMIGDTIIEDVPLSLLEKRSFMRLSIEERRKVLKMQASAAVNQSDSDTDDELIGGGEFIDDDE